MGRLIAIEGIDGSGKQTLTRRVADRWSQAGARIVTLGFPRYGVDVHADLVRDALYGRLGDLADSVYGPAVLFALDRRAAADEIRGALAEADLVLLDRYVSSNAAYGAARQGAPDVPSDFPDWVRELEIDRFGVPVPTHQILLAPPVTVAADRARRRSVQADDRALDSFESDGGLQARVDRMYRRLADQSYLCPWTVLTGDEAELPEALTP
ncbi:dTMP kinase [Nakamurella flava]|uniref:Thymidylate kinase n=1 Tax=Nakamurella flava TaxID=2576308 RepID=A0A4U6QMW6_9ACTN|nr:dTMP kinase [Nakamurella flava]TKV61518.1 dTMP kinase [Nakamurella flava]